MWAFHIPSCGNFLPLDVFETGCSVCFFFFLLHIAEGILWTLRFLWRKVAWETFPSFLFELPYTFHSVLGMGCLTWLVLKACRNWTYSYLFREASDNSALVHCVKWGVGARGASQPAIGVGFYQAIKTWSSLEREMQDTQQLLFDSWFDSKLQCIADIIQAYVKLLVRKIVIHLINTAEASVLRFYYVLYAGHRCVCYWFSYLQV